MTKRAIFEDVGAVERVEPAPRRERVAWRRGIALWLWTLAALVTLMIVVGGLTRLTDSGLSITVWDPVMHVVPPLSEAEWQDAFAAYQTTTEFREQNHWMTLADFKPIYWWEWGHRALGQLIGAVWAAGFLTFLVARRIPRGWTGRLLLPGLLGGLQGAVGWWMVVSGLDRLDVASYRLATHLGLAFVILMLLAWYAQKVRLDPVAALSARRRRVGLASGALGALTGVVFLQIVVGALVAGIDAGRGYPDWPLMQGQFFPADAFLYEPLWRNFFESPGLVQFVHRMLGYAVLLFGLAVTVPVARAGLDRLRGRGWTVLAVLALQVVIGIVTVIHAAPLWLASLHQAGAILLVLALMRARFAAHYPEAQRITA